MTEEVEISNLKGKKYKVHGRVDTGATTSSLDVNLAAKLRLGPILDSRLIKSASGSSLRPIVKANIKIGDKEFETEFTLADRSDLKYEVLIGRNILNEGFLIDPTKE